MVGRRLCFSFWFSESGGRAEGRSVKKLEEGCMCRGVIGLEKGKIK